MSNKMLFEIAKYFILWLTPIVFIIGLLLLVFSKGKYDVLGEIFDKERGFTLRVIPWLERNVYGAHKWLLKRQGLVGWFLIVYAIVLFIVMINK